MKIAIVFPTYWHSDDPSKSSINIKLYVSAISALGHEAMIVCRDDSHFSPDLPVISVPQQEWEDPRFWRTLRLDIAIVFTWLRHTTLLKALKDAEVFAVAKADTDGMPSARVFPCYYYQMMMSSAHTLWERVQTLRHWMRRRFTHYKEPDREIIESLSLAAHTAVETQSAKASLTSFLAFYERQELQAKLIVLPHLISEEILNASIETKKRKKIVAIGRWDSPQKDAPLLARTLRLYLRSCPDTEVVLIGRGGATVFASLCQQYPQVSYVGAIPREKIVSYLADTRLILVVSRWESFHIAAHEALCLGATVVGPAVIPVPDICREGPYGTMAAGRQPRQIAKALEEEMNAWDADQRDPLQIAGFWRPRLSGKSIVQTVLALADEKKLSCGPFLAFPQALAQSSSGKN